MRPRHDLIWDVLRFPTETSLWRCNRGNLSPDQVRLKALQPLQTNSKVLSPDEISAGSPICRRCSHHRPLSRRPSECHEPFQQGISGFSENQPDETVGHGSGCGLTSKHYNLGAWTGVFTWLRLPVLWLDNLWYSISGLQTNGPTRCFEHAAVRQRVLHHICSLCGKVCHSRIGLFSHTRRCSRTTNLSATQQSFEIVGCQWNEKKLTILLKRECLKLRSLRKPNASKTS